MERLMEKLEQIDDESGEPWKEWTLQEKKELLEVYWKLCKKEHVLFALIYRWHGCDSFEDIFRDYNGRILDDKEQGVEIAIKNIEEKLQTPENVLENPE